jgi:hypothetical protein
VVWLKGRDDPAVGTETRILKQTEVVASVVDRRRDEDGRASIIVQTRLEAEILDYVGHDTLLTFARAHQFFHRRPAFT